MRRYSSTLQGRVTQHGHLFLFLALPHVSPPCPMCRGCGAAPRRTDEAMVMLITDRFTGRCPDIYRTFETRTMAGRSVPFSSSKAQAAEQLSHLNSACLLFSVIHEINIFIGQLLCDWKRDALRQQESLSIVPLVVSYHMIITSHCVWLMKVFTA